MVNKKRLKYAFLLVTIASMVFPASAYADSFDWIGNAMVAGLAKLIMAICKPIFDGMLTAIRYVMLNPTDLKSIPYIGQLESASQIIAGSLLFTNLAFKAFNYQVNGTTGGNSEPMTQILGKTFISGILIFGLPWILENVFLKANDFLMNYVNSLGVNLEKVLPDLAVINNVSLVLAIFLLLFLVALVGLLISNTVRIAELILLYLAAPILAVSHAGKGESLQIWIMQAVAVSFTQVVQYVLVGISFNLLLNAEVQWWSLLGAIGAVVVAIRGPQLLKQFLYSSGVAGSAAGVGQQALGTAIYKVMMKGK